MTKSAYEENQIDSLPLYCLSISIPTPTRNIKEFLIEKRNPIVITGNLNHRNLLGGSKPIVTLTSEFTPRRAGILPAKALGRKHHVDDFFFSSDDMGCSLSFLLLLNLCSFLSVQGKYVIRCGNELVVTVD